ncbi:hypothetical protein SCYAM73S_03337 [Streptomyces cyaneofuscatus]
MRGPRAERGGQDHGRTAADHAAAAGRGFRAGRRARPGPGGRRRPAPDRCHRAGRVGRRGPDRPSEPAACSAGCTGCAAAAGRATELLDRFGLAEAADRPASTYSGGMRRRLDLAASLASAARRCCSWTSRRRAWTRPAATCIWDAVRALNERGHDRAPHHAVPGGGRPPRRRHRPGGPRPGRAHRVPRRNSRRWWGRTPRSSCRMRARWRRRRRSSTGSREPNPSLDPARSAVGAVAKDPTLTLPRLVRELTAAGVRCWT